MLVAIRVLVGIDTLDVKNANAVDDGNDQGVQPDLVNLKYFLQSFQHQNNSWTTYSMMA